MRSVFLAIMLLSAALPVPAQLADTAATSRCLAAIPASALTRAPIHLEATVDSANRHVLWVADTLTLLTARVIRASFGPGDSLPPADELLHWRQLDAAVQVAVHRDGRVTWSVPPLDSTAAAFRLEPDTAFNAARNLIVQALMVVRDAGIRMGWPAGASGDSIPFTLEYTQPLVRQDGTLKPMEARFALPVFALAVPWEREVAVRRMKAATYPEKARAGGVEGTVILQFVVDTTGRVKPGTIREQWPAGTPRPPGALGGHYRDFVQSSIRSLREARFTPALIGGCAVSQLARMPFVFELRS